MPKPSKLPKRRFFNRELSWLEFNQRVLEHASDAKTPLMERLKFLAITSSNLDEFFMVRVGGLRLKLRKSKSSVEPSGLSTADQLESILYRHAQMVSDQYSELLEQIEPLLAEREIQRATLV